MPAPGSRQATFCLGGRVRCGHFPSVESHTTWPSGLGLSLSIASSTFIQVAAGVRASSPLFVAESQSPRGHSAHSYSGGELGRLHPRLSGSVGVTFTSRCGRDRKSFRMEQLSKICINVYRSVPPASVIELHGLQMFFSFKLLLSPINPTRSKRSVCPFWEEIIKKCK